MRPEKSLGVTVFGSFHAGARSAAGEGRANDCGLARRFLQPCRVFNGGAGRMLIRGRTASYHRRTPPIYSVCHLKNFSRAAGCCRRQEKMCHLCTTKSTHLDKNGEREELKRAIRAAKEGCPGKQGCALLLRRAHLLLLSSSRLRPHNLSSIAITSSPHRATDAAVGSSISEASNTHKYHSQVTLAATWTMWIWIRRARVPSSQQRRWLLASNSLRTTRKEASTDV